jgi:1,2-diacylglycerol 3-alpha-glucosyltransferase
VRIAFVTNNYTPYASGLVSSLDVSYYGLCNAGYDVHLITLDFIDNHQHDPAYVLRIPSIARFFYKTNHMALPLLTSYYMHKYFDTIKPDLIHVHHPFLLGPVATYRAHRLKIPIVFTHHTLYEDYAHYVPLPKMITQPIITQMIKRFYKQIDGVIVPSSRIKSHVESRYAPHTPIAVVPSSILPCYVYQTMPKNVSAKRFGWNLLMITRFGWEKNITQALDFFSLLPKGMCKFTIAGCGSELAAIKKYAYHTLGLSVTEVFFIYKPDKALLHTLYKQADLFIFSSKTDTQGIVLAESMAHGIPVISYDGPGQRDIVVNGHNGFIVDDAYAMKGVIERIMHDYSLYEKLCFGACHTAQMYTPEVMADRLSRFYHQIKHVHG